MRRLYNPDALHAWVKEIDTTLQVCGRLLKRHGCDVNGFKYIKVTVTKTHDPEARRPFPDSHHHHILMGGIPEELRGEVERLWPFGFCNADRLQPDDKGVSAVGGYVARRKELERL